jgi:hypothetical protein
MKIIEALIDVVISVEMYQQERTWCEKVATDNIGYSISRLLDLEISSSVSANSAEKDFSSTKPQIFFQIIVDAYVCEHGDYGSRL